MIVEPLIVQIIDSNEKSRASYVYKHVTFIILFYLKLLDFLLYLKLS